MQRNNPFSSGSVLAALVLSAMTATGAGSVELSADRHLSQPTANISQAKLARDQARVTAEKATWLRWRRTGSRHGYPRPGHTVRHGQRMARKARNVARHRLATRGGR